MAMAFHELPDTAIQLIAQYVTSFRQRCASENAGVHGALTRVMEQGACRHATW